MHQLAAEPSYRLLLLDERLGNSRSWPIPVAISALVHIVVAVALIRAPMALPTEPQERITHRVTHLVDPPSVLTQRAPNKAPITPQISIGRERQASAPTSVPVPKRTFVPPPAQVTPRSVAKASTPQEPPKLDAAPVTPQLTLPQRPVEPPKLALESIAPASKPGTGTGRLKVPGNGIQEALQQAMKSGPRANTVGDNTDDWGPVTHGLNTTPSPTRPKSSVELLSDPQGVDFKPYLLQILQSIRRNWFAVMPESARLGQRGTVVLQFAIAPNGKVLKVAFSSESGARPLDRAAVAALSASDPLPPLPLEFKGDRIVLQFTFAYNAAR